MESQAEAVAVGASSPRCWVNGQELEGVVSLDIRPAAVPMSQTDSLRQIGQQFAASVHAITAAVHPLMLALIDFGKSCTAFLEAVKGKAVPQAGRILFIADDDGNVSFGGYRENLDWLHGLLEMRYGREFVSPIDPGPLRFFIFERDKAWQRNARWAMYANIPETCDPQLREAGYHSHS